MRIENNYRQTFIDNMEKTFTISGLKCQHCKANVENTVGLLRGVARAVASLEQHSLLVEYDEAIVTPTLLKEAVESTGSYELEV